MNALVRNRGNRGGILKILLIILGVFLVICLAVAVYIGTHWKGWIVNAANTVAERTINESGLPQDQKDSILVEVRQLGDDFKSGRITTEQLGKIAKAIGDSPLIPLAGVQAAKQKYIVPSDMTDKEKAAAILHLQRFARGVFEKKIDKDVMNDVVKPVSEIKPNNRWTLKDHPTRMEIDQFIANAKAKADDAMIPEEPFDLNIADELKKAIHGA